MLPLYVGGLASIQGSAVVPTPPRTDSALLLHNFISPSSFPMRGRKEIAKQSKFNPFCYIHRKIDLSAGIKFAIVCALDRALIGLAY